MALAGAFAAVACVVDESFPDGQFLCDPKGGGDECPAGLKCTPQGTCRHSTALIDGGGPDSCFPTTCGALAPKCGTQSDGCGNTIKCDCTAPDTCGGWGDPPNVGECGCSQSQNNLRPADTGFSDGASGGVAWQNAENVRASDNQYATAAFSDPKSSAILKAAAFGFKLPEKITITGIQVDIDRSATNSDTAITDKDVKLYVGSTYWPTSLTKPLAWSKVDTTNQYGGKGQLWGETAIDKTDVERSDFGVALTVSASAADTARVDQIRVTVFFNNPDCPHP